MVLLLLTLASHARAVELENAPDADPPSELQDCGLVSGETYRIGIGRLQLADGRVVTGWRNCIIPVGVRLSLQYNEDPTPDASVELEKSEDKTPIPPDEKQTALDSSAQAAAVGGIAAFLTKHPEVLLMEVRVTAPCLSDGTPDPIGASAAGDLASRLTSLGIQQDRARVVQRQCASGAKGVRIEAVVVRAQQ